MDLTSLRIFVKVADVLSFTRAAEQLGLTKARASAHVQGLEESLGVRLFTRTTRSVRLTGDGEQLLGRARRLLAEADEMTSLFGTARALKGRVRIDLPERMASEVVIPRLPELLARHPNLELSLSSTDRRVAVVQEGFDCVVRVGTLSDSGLTARRLGALQMMNCASPDYLRRYGAPRTLEDLKGHVVVHYSVTGDDAPGLEVPDGSGGYREIPMKAWVTVNSTAAYQAACLAGLGIVQAPARSLSRLVQTGSLVEVLPEHTAAPMPVSIVHAHGKQVPVRVRAVMDWLGDVVTQTYV
ncbi:MAG: LysR family transcriptional regulator [Polyangiaceae bacterium]